MVSESNKTYLWLTQIGGDAMEWLSNLKTGASIVFQFQGEEESRIKYFGYFIAQEYRFFDSILDSVKNHATSFATRLETTKLLF